MSWQSIVKTVAPTIAAALGGPLGGLAVSTLAGALLPEEKVAEAQGSATRLEKLVKDAVAAPGVDLDKMREAEQRFESRLAELGIDLEKVHAADRASARERQAGTGDKTPAVLAYLYTLGFFGILYVLVFHGAKVDPGVRGLLQTLLGVFLGMLTGAKEYFFGSSAGSAAKNVLLSRFGGPK